MVETALFVSATLIFMLGIIQIGVLGFLQLTTDAAAYYDARANVLTVSSYSSPEQATHAAFPQIPVSDISPTAVPAPTPTIPVDYGYNGTASQQASAQVERHGGASMMQPEQLQVTVTLPNVSRVLGQALGTNGVAIEPKWVECGTHDDISGEACSLASPGPDSQNNYFTQGENTPPYFVGFNYLQQCSTTQPWGIYTGSNPAWEWGFVSLNGGSGWPGAVAPWTSSSPCSNGANYSDSQISFIALGVAEFLDSSNWGDTSAGVSGACDSSGGTSQAVFEAAAYHQRMYALIAQYLSEYPYQFEVEEQSQYADSVANPNNQFTYMGWGGAGAYGNTGDAGNIAIPEAISSFKNWEGFDDWGNFNNGSAPSATNDKFNWAVQTVYSWDISVGQGNGAADPTYNNPTHPEVGCT
jgi:hypothetical protein